MYCDCAWKIKVNAAIGALFLVANTAMSLFAAWEHLVLWMAVSIVGIFGSAAGLWFNGSQDGIQFMRDLWGDR